MQELRMLSLFFEGSEEPQVHGGPVDVYIHLIRDLHGHKNRWQISEQMNKQKKKQWIE